VAKALHYLGLNGQGDRIPGMTITLLPHQLMGVAWMLQQEKGSLSGGCLADEMGLGKVGFPLCETHTLNVDCFVDHTNVGNTSTLLFAN